MTNQSVSFSEALALVREVDFLYECLKGASQEIFLEQLPWNADRGELLGLLQKDLQSRPRLGDAISQEATAVYLNMIYKYSVAQPKEAVSTS